MCSKLNSHDSFIHSFYFDSFPPASYQQEIPSRFKKELVFQCHRNSSLLATTATIAAAPKNKTNEAVEGIEQLLQNIGIFGSQITHDDVEAIVSELGGGSADKILQKVL
uniref:Uncharacterized protein n=1 Tax=Pseudo-nitzschia australis TaxID=44445 RepID=A0A7S4ENN4_9STRA